MRCEGSSRKAQPRPLPEEAACLCCCHFAMDLEAAPEACALPPSRRPKRHAMAAGPSLVMVT